MKNNDRLNIRLTKENADFVRLGADLLGESQANFIDDIVSFYRTSNPSLADEVLKMAANRAKAVETKTEV